MTPTEKEPNDDESMVDEPGAADGEGCSPSEPRPGARTGLIELYEPDGVFEPRAGVVLRGTAEIMPALTELASMPTEHRLRR